MTHTGYPCLTDFFDTAHDDGEPAALQFGLPHQFVVLFGTPAELREWYSQLGERLQIALNEHEHAIARRTDVLPLAEARTLIHGGGEAGSTAYDGSPDVTVGVCGGGGAGISDPQLVHPDHAHDDENF